MIKPPPEASKEKRVQPGQTRALRALLAAEPRRRFNVGVTHQVNITALTGENPLMGETIIMGSGGRALLGTRFG